MCTLSCGQVHTIYIPDRSKPVMRVEVRSKIDLGNPELCTAANSTSNYVQAIVVLPETFDVFAPPFSLSGMQSLP